MFVGRVFRQTSHDWSKQDAGDEGALDEEKALALQENEAEARERKRQDLAMTLLRSKACMQERMWPQEE